MDQIWNSKKRNQNIKKAGTGQFDIIIIGGGITGAGIAREAALRNLSFCLVDKNDFAFGTSSRSSKLVHGGIRYIANGEFKLVRESTTERNWLIAHLPHLVRPLGFLFCSYAKGKDRPYQIRFALTAYGILSDWFSKFKNFRKPRFFSPEFIEEIEPAVTLNDPSLGRMKLAGFYYDTNVDDARLTIETIKESLIISKGSSVALNYTEVEDFTRDPYGKVDGIKIKDHLSKKEHMIKGRTVIACGGIWTDEILKHADFEGAKIFPTKGVHIVVPNERLGNRNAFGVRSFDDGRFFFVLRRGKLSIIGTTDTDYYKESTNLDEPWCTKEDCDYLLNTVNRLFPHARLTYKDIVGTYAGIRPLIRQEGAASESAVSREHEIFESKDGVVIITGGKLTTYRLMAEELIFYLREKGYLPEFEKPEYCEKGFTKVPYRVGISREDFDQIVDSSDLHEVSWPEQLEYLHQQYGIQGIAILKKIQQKRSWGEPILEGYPLCRAEIEFILEHENAPRLIDVLCRRTEAQWTIWHHKQTELAKKVADLMASYYRWPPRKKREEINNYIKYIKKTIWF